MQRVVADEGIAVLCMVAGCTHLPMRLRPCCLAGDVLDVGAGDGGLRVGS